MNNFKKAISFYNDTMSKKNYFPKDILYWQIIGKFSPALRKIIGDKNVMNICDKRHKKTLDYLEKYIPKTLVTYKNFEEESYPIKEKTIWTMWWQGKDNAPELVRNTIENMEKIAKENDYKLIVITENNYSDYVTLPKHILDLVEQRKITKTTLSDIIRVNLLALHGGVWLDSTVYITSMHNFDSEFYSIKTGEYSDFSPNISKNRWKGFVMSTNRENHIIFNFLKDSFNEYYLNHEYIVDYLIIDYILALGYVHIEKIRKYVDEVVISNKELYFLDANLNKEYNEEKWKKINLDTTIFKMTYRNKIEKNKNSYYNKVVLESIVK